jgi:hypothetical protein
MGRRRISFERLSRKHNKLIEKISREPEKYLPIKGEIRKIIQFPHSLVNGRELADLIVFTHSTENGSEIFNLYFIELKTGAMKGAKAVWQIKTALKYFLLEFEDWKKRIFGIPQESQIPVTVNSLLVWWNEVIPPRLEIISWKKKRI